MFSQGVGLLVGSVAASPEGRSCGVRALESLTSAATCSTLLRMSKTISPPKPSRVSVPLSAEALEAFQRLAKAGNMSTGKAIASWLDDTLDAAQYMAETMEKARSAPRLVAQQLHAYALGLSDETAELIKQVSESGRKARGTDAAGTGRAPRAPIPPSCNTGGKLPRANPNLRGGK